MGHVTSRVPRESKHFQTSVITKTTLTVQNHTAEKPNPLA